MKMRFIKFLKHYDMKNIIHELSSKQTIKTNANFVFIFLFVFLIFTVTSCKKEKKQPQPNPSENLALDSLVATKRNIVTWEEIYITAYARGKNLKFNWSANHGSMLATDSVTVKYWGCPSCVGHNTIECKVSNDYGTVSDTIMIRVNP